MSKYYKVEDVIRAIAEQLCWEARTEYGDKFTTEDWLEEAEGYVSELPTIEVSEDCISRADLIKSFLDDNECDREEAKACMCSLDLMLELIENAPRISSELKPDYKYCPNCGSKMKGEE